MKQWKTALIAASPAFLLLLLLVILAMVFCYSRRLFLHGRGNNDMGDDDRGYRNHGNCINVVGMKKKKKIKKPFVWSENPSLIVEAVERGWVAFAFTYHNPLSSSSSWRSPSASIICPLSLSTWTPASLGLGHHQRYKKEEEEDGSEPEISWEVVVCAEEGGGVSSSSSSSSSSVHLYMQRLCFNPCVAAAAAAAQVEATTATTSLLQVLQACLPLPGPPSSSSSSFTSASASFPQQAYFELTIVVAPQQRNREPPHEHQKPPPQLESASGSGSAKLNQYEKTHDRSSRESGTSQEEDMGGGVMQILPNTTTTTNNGVTINKHDSSSVTNLSVTDVIIQALSNVDDDPTQILAIGLAPLGFPPSTLPGSHPGSVGLHSNGFVYLSGAPKLPAIKPLWNVVNTTIGCGFDPTAKSVFFTLNGELVHEFNALGTEFGHPLFPTVAANYNVTLLVNFGQCSFAYAHANSLRIPDPGFRQRSAKNVFMIEDSGDLFSMGRIDSRWFEVRFSSMGGSHPLDAAESDLFEIVLDNSRRR